MSWSEAEITALREAAGAATSVAERAETIDVSAPPPEQHSGRRVDGR